MVDNLRGPGGSLGGVGTTTLDKREGWLASRSSLTNADERRLVDLTGIEPVTS